MNAFKKALEKKVLVVMGPVGTNLHQKGKLELGANTSFWCLENEGEFSAFLREWVDIGCDIIFANTGALNPLLLEGNGRPDQLRQDNLRLVKLAGEATRGSALVAADMQSMILSTGRFLPPLGDLTRDELYGSYRLQAEAFREAGADLIWLMTMVDLEEVKIALQAVKEAVDLPVLVSYAFELTAKGFRTMMGLSEERAAARSEIMGADATGVNCGKISQKETAQIVKKMKNTCNLPIIAMPGAGTPQLKEGKTVYPVSPREMSREALGWVNAGAGIISGCCGTTLEHVAEIIGTLRRQ